MADSGAPGGAAPAEARSGAGEAAGGRKIGLAMGAVPFGAGWLTDHKVKRGLALGLLQAGGIVLSLYASHMQTAEQNDAFKTRDEGELATVQTWQWVQRVSLSTALGAYLFSLIASAGD
ncbi:MAG TPA: hypothetical protein VJ385_03660, partial [Fibrobacteria bacterium]|nr:hypothetical protein [Fibrobacteria bacterium]